MLDCTRAISTFLAGIAVLAAEWSGFTSKRRASAAVSLTVARAAGDSIANVRRSTSEPFGKVPVGGMAAEGRLCGTASDNVLSEDGVATGPAIEKGVEGVAGFMSEGNARDAVPESSEGGVKIGFARSAGVLRSLKSGGKEKADLEPAFGDRVGLTMEGAMDSRPDFVAESGSSSIEMFGIRAGVVVAASGMPVGNARLSVVPSE